MANLTRRVVLAGCIVALTALLVGPPAAQAQSQPNISISGFVKSEYLYDTRQVVGLREGEFSLWPQPAEFEDGRDRNATDNLGFFAFFSRLGFSVEGGEAMGAQTSGLIEADFYGALDATVSTFRLRRAFVTMDWGDYEVLFGQEWSPLSNAGVFPQTLSTNAGTPFNPFARFPQARFTYRPGAARIIGVLSMHRDAFSDLLGTSPDRSVQQQAALPAAHLHAQYHFGANDASVVGAGAMAKWLRPELLAERFSAGAVQAYANLAQPGFAVQGKVTYGSTLTDHNMTGGYVGVAGGGFEPLEVASGWIEVHTTGTVQAGVFAGYLTNLGFGGDGPVARNAQGDLVAPFGVRAPDLDHLWRVSPRVVYVPGPLRFGLEVEVMTAQYGVPSPQNYEPDVPEGMDPVTNVRTNFTVQYNF